MILIIHYHDRTQYIDHRFLVIFLRKDTTGEYPSIPSPFFAFPFPEAETALKLSPSFGTLIF